MSNKTLLVVGVAGVVGIAVLIYWRRAQAATPGAPYVPPFVQATPLQITGGAYPDPVTGSYHIPKALRTPAQEILAAAAEARANTGASRF